jgi:hypothetical protein
LEDLTVGFLADRLDAWTAALRQRSFDTAGESAAAAVRRQRIDSPRTARKRTRVSPEGMT